MLDIFVLEMITGQGIVRGDNIMHTPTFDGDRVRGSNRARPVRSVVWTPTADARFQQLFADGQSIRGLARSFGIGRQSAQKRALKLGLVSLASLASLKAPVGVVGRQASPESIDLGREALPAGHPLSWGLLVQGTCLEGMPYPTPDTSRLCRSPLISGDRS